MTIVKFKRNRLPWYDTMFTDIFDSDRLLTNDFFTDKKWIPEMNIKENDENYEIEVAAPGFDKKDFKITIENGVLHLSAEKEKETIEEEENFARREFIHDSFLRTMTLPETINDEEKVKAKYKNGILKLVLAKQDIEKIAKKRIIEIS